MGTKDRSPAPPGDPPRPTSWIDGLATLLTARAANAAPEHRADRLAEEWRAHALELPVATSRLKFAIGCCWAARVISRDDLGIAPVLSSAPAGEIIMAAYAQRSRPLFARETPSDATNILCEINTTPLIDIMLVLLIALIIALPLMTHAVTIELSRGSPPVTLPQPEVIDLDIEFDGTVLWNGTALQSMQQLEGYFRAAAPKNPQPQIRLRPSPNVRYDYVARVLALAQRNRLQRIGFMNPTWYQD
jgi:biopolymer transport protein ExbD